MRFFIVILVVVCARVAQADTSTTPTDLIVNQIGILEGNKEPKCYATASRLEDFIYGTPLDDGARFGKIELQKQLARRLWANASARADQAGAKRIAPGMLQAALDAVAIIRRQGENWQVQVAKTTVDIDAVDKRQYGSIAYALRAILAVQQDNLLGGSTVLPLNAAAVDRLREFLDVTTLAALSIADRQARLANEFQITRSRLKTAWKTLLPDAPDSTTGNTPPVATAAAVPKPNAPRFALLRKMVAQKIASYQAYNKISAQVFLRNLQVYFARNSWPEDPEQGRQFKVLFTAAMVNFAKDLMFGAEQQARKQGHAIIRVADVDAFAHRFIPHRTNTYEDVIFFPALAPEQRVTIESYDMDAFRDSGIHWRYLESAVDSKDYGGRMEPDPFAAELLTENIAQFGVLLLREAGMIGLRKGAQRLSPDHINPALQEIQRKVNDSARAKPAAAAEQTLASADEPISAARDTQFFSNVSQAVGIDYVHRSSDWLNRLIRSFAMKSENVGQLTIPPAFGGSGVAADDVNNDGWPDVLLVGGLGNRLYINNQHGGFNDATRASGLDWTRPDGHPGEPRQPLIADFDNDGRKDIFISYANDAHRLFRNLGNGRFQDVTAHAGLGGQGLVGGPAIVADFDNDGLLDLYISYFGDYLHGILPTLARRNHNGLPNRLFKNQGNFRFKDITPGSGVDNSGWSQALTHTDLDGDGRQDIIVGNDFGVNAYYHNQGGGKFEEISARIGTDKPSYTMNISVADLNDDLLPDIYISNIVTMNKDEKYVLPGKATPMKFDPTKLAHMRVVEANDLFISQRVPDAPVRYQLSHAVGRGYSSTGWAWGASFLDFDNDGDEDLYVLNGMNEFNLYSSENPYFTDSADRKQQVYIPVSTRESNVFFVNRNGRLENAAKQSGADLLGNSRSAVYLDYDRDGDLDMLLNNYHGAAVFYRNNSHGPHTHWLSIQLEGDPAQHSNRDAIGARIIATTTDGNRIWREIHGGSGYLTAFPKEQHFGLGKHKKADIQIIWPNGKTTRYADVHTDQRYRVRQKDGTLETVGPGSSG